MARLENATVTYVSAAAWFKKDAASQSKPGTPLPGAFDDDQNTE